MVESNLHINSYLTYFQTSHSPINYNSEASTKCIPVKEMYSFTCCIYFLKEISMSEFVRPISPWRRWNTEMVLMPCHWIGKVCSCAPVFNLLRLPPTVDITKCRSPKTAKMGFSLPEGDRINRARRILTRKRALWVSYSTPDLALIRKRVSVQDSPKCQNLPKRGHRKPTQ